MEKNHYNGPMQQLANERVLVTGAAGFLGYQLVLKLLQRGAHVIAADLALSRLDRLANLKGVTIAACDITQREPIAGIVKERRPDIVAHLASVINCPDAGLNYKVNYEGTKNLADVMSEANLNRIIFISSMTATFKRMSAYGESKKLAEEYLKNKGLRPAIVRTNFIYGPGGPTFLKLADFVKMLPGFVPVVGNGRALKQPIFVKDLAEFIVRLMETQSYDEIFEIGGPDRISFNELLDAVMRAMGTQKTKIHFPSALCTAGAQILSRALSRPPLTPENVYEIDQSVTVESQSLQKRFGFTMRGLKEGLGECFNGQNA